MISITGLYCGTLSAGAAPGGCSGLFSISSKPSHSSRESKPVVVWNCTRRCNLRCILCQADAGDRPFPNELTTQEGETLIRDLAQLGAPVLLFAGGEPLLRGDLFDLARLAATLGIRPLLSTNGTLISKEIARDLKKAGFAHVWVTLDGVGDGNDLLRGEKGAFDDALYGFQKCADAKLHAGLWFSLTKYSFGNLSLIFGLIEEERVSAACFGHLVYSVRHSTLREHALSREETRRAIDLIIDKAADFQRRGLEKELVTKGNDTDGVYVYQRMVREGSDRAESVLQLLRLAGGNSSGAGIGNVDSEGNVHPDQFWQHYSLGSVRDRPFSKIWMDTSDPVLAQLRNRKPFLKGRCADCGYVDICNGNYRVRAEGVHGDIWEEDPACYLSDEELSMRDHCEVR